MGVEILAIERLHAILAILNGFQYVPHNVGL